MSERHECMKKCGKPAVDYVLVTLVIGDEPIRFWLCAAHDDDALARSVNELSHQPFKEWPSAAPTPLSIFLGREMRARRRASRKLPSCSVGCCGKSSRIRQGPYSKEGAPAATP
jgi:hypothetical protein